MPLLANYEELLACPACRGRLKPAETGFECRDCIRNYRRVGPPPGWPVLIDDSKSVVDTHQVQHGGGSSQIKRLGEGTRLAWVHRLVTPQNSTAESYVRRLVADLRSQGVTRPRILVVGGGAIGSGIEELYVDPSVDIVAFDIYGSPRVQLVADGHQIPLRDACVDGVVVQAVLEHVLEPTLVVAEIHRVLRANGLVYADTPFLQHVHEGPFDFTRFTESGHRYLFRDFEAVESGAVAGLGTALLWSIDAFLHGLTRGRLLSRLVRVALFWLSRLDARCDPRVTVDGASSVFFYGRRSTSRMTPAEVIAHYQGSQ